MSTLMDQLLADQMRLRGELCQRNGGRQIDTHTELMDSHEPWVLPHTQNEPNDAAFLSVEFCSADVAREDSAPPAPRDTAAFWSVVCASCFGLAAVVAWAVVAFLGVL